MSKLRVLCVDDNPEMRRLFQLLLRGNEHVELAGALESADHLEQKLAEVQPKVVVLDLSMPGRKPLDALREAKAQFPEINFLVSSAHDDEMLIADCMAAGATGYLVKGGDFDDLVQGILEVAEGRPVLPKGKGLKR